MKGLLMKKYYKVLLIILCVVCIGALGYGVYYKFLYEKPKEYNGTFYASSLVASYSNGAEIEVGVEWEFPSNEDYVYVEFKVKSSEGFEFIKEEFSSHYITSYKKKKNKYMIKLKNAEVVSGENTEVVRSGIRFIYKVLDENKDFNIKLYDVYFKNKEGKLFKAEDVSFSIGEDIVYKCNYNENYKYVTEEQLKLKWFTKNLSYKLETSLYNCEEYDLDIEKGYSIVEGVYSDSKVLLYKDKKYYLYDVNKKEFILETEEIKSINETDDDKWFPLTNGYSYIDTNEKSKNAYGISIYKLDLYINLDKNEAYYDFITGDNRIVYNKTGEFSYTDGKLIKFAKREDSDGYSSSTFGFFNGENYTYIDKNYTSCAYNYLLNNQNKYTILCYKDFNNSKENQKLTLFDMKGNIIFDSDKYLSYFVNSIDNIIIYKEKESSINKLNMIDYNGNLIAYLEYSDDSNDTSDSNWLELYMISEEDIDKCFSYYDNSNYFDNKKHSDYLVIYEGKAKIFKYNASNKTYEYLKDTETCPNDNMKR